MRHHHARDRSLPLRWKVEAARAPLTFNDELHVRTLQRMPPQILVVAFA
jgi:hypothetical protein